MANKTLNVTLLLRNDPAATWATNNPTLAKGELGIENDTRKFKIGDGITAWNNLKYAGSGSIEVKTAAPTTGDHDFDVGTIWFDTTHSKMYVLFSKSGSSATWVEVPTVNSTVAKSEEADKLATPRNITIKGAVQEISKSFDGGADIEFNLVLETTGVTGGTYTKVTVNDKGLITAAEQLTAADIPTLTMSKISDLGTAAGKDVGVAAGNVPVLDAEGKLNTSVLPSLALTDVYTVATEAEMLALDAQKGDIAIRSDVTMTFILAADDATKADSWVALRTPDSKVLSVNGKTGVVVLSSDDVAEGTTNLYFTEERATANFNANFETKSVTGLADGANVVLDTDTITLDCGNA